jgi:UDP-glucose-4-epimerase GalE
MRAVNAGNIVFSSTAAVYGDPRKDEPLKESDLTSPINPYGASKLAAEELIKAAAFAYGMKYAILRYFNAAGADEEVPIGLTSDNYSHLIPIAVRGALGLGDPVRVFGDDWPTPDGTCIRDYIHVSDLSDAHIKAARYLKEEKESLLLNLGTSTGSSVMEVIKAVSVLRPCPFVMDGRREGDPAVLIADAYSSKSILGWQATRDLAKIVETDLSFRTKSAYRSGQIWPASTCTNHSV